MIIKSWKTYWNTHNLWSDAHIYGTSLVNHDIKQFFILIPKNASTWTRSVKKYNFVECNYHNEQLIKKGYTPLIILRDPYSRWTSGITEFIARRGLWENWKENFNQLVIDLIFTRIAFDEHTESQSMYLEDIDPLNCIFFKHDNNLSKNISQWLTDSGVDNTLDKLSPQHLTKGHKLQIKNYFSDLINITPNFKNKLDAYYQVDFDLLKSVQYYKQQGNE